MSVLGLGFEASDNIITPVASLLFVSILLFVLYVLFLSLNSVQMSSLFARRSAFVDLSVWMHVFLPAGERSCRSWTERWVQCLLEKRGQCRRYRRPLTSGPRPGLWLCGAAATIQ